MDEMFEKSDNSRFLIKKTHRKSIDMTTEILYSVQVSDCWTGCRGTVGSAPHW